jgi:hypothetical protein
LYFVSDRTGWWNLYRWLPSTPPNPPELRGGGTKGGGVEPLCEMEAEFGLPQWVFGMSTYAVESANRIICTYTQEGIWYLASLDTQTKQLEVIETPYTDISSVHADK